MNEEAGDFLKKLPSPLGIISVAGMYRTGKSYLLNRMLLDRSGGFGVGPTINPCTKVSRVLNFQIFVNRSLLSVGSLDLDQAYPRVHTRGRTH
jgi:Guanylate-binding protein, N-terminal domain